MEYHHYEGHRIAFHVAGTGPVMIFLHNGGNDHRIWDRQVEFFARDHRVYAMDLLGNGASDRPVIDYTLDRYVAILHDFITARCPGRVILAGNCIGSAMSLQYAAEHPDAVAALVLCNIVTERTVAAGFFGLCYRLSSFRPLRALLGRLAAWDFFSRLLNPVKYLLQFGGPRGRDRDFRRHLFAVYSAPGHLRVLYNLLLNMPGFARLDRFTKPAGFPPLQIIWGEGNRVLPSRAGRRLCEQLAADAVHFIDGAGHLVMRERHEEVNRIMAAGVAAAEAWRSSGGAGR